MASTKKTITIELTDDIITELNDIVQHIGIANPNILIKNYIREVIIAARVEQAVANTRQDILKKSTDLDFLAPPKEKA